MKLDVLGDVWKTHKYQLIPLLNIQFYKINRRDKSQSFPLNRLQSGDLGYHFQHKNIKEYKKFSNNIDFKNVIIIQVTLIIWSEKKTSKTLTN